MSEDMFEGVRTPPAALASTDALTLRKVRAFMTASKLQADVRFNPADVDSALIEQAALYAEYGQYQALAILQRDQLETRLELLQARLDVAYRERLEKEGKKITEKVIEARIRTNPLYLQTKAALSEAEAVVTLLKTTLNSLEQKRDMLVQINKNKEREWQYQSALVEAGAAAAQLKQSYRDRVKSLTPNRVA